MLKIFSCIFMVEDISCVYLDVFVKSDITSFVLSRLSCFLPNIHSTSKLEKNKTLLFLNVSSIRNKIIFDATVYMKPKSHDIYLNWK